MICALIGNQNSGKTTLFNALTGSNQKVGNWPGVTIEKKSGFIKNSDIEVNDLPGIYSLSPYTLEEDVSRKYLFTEKNDLIINIIDATSLERSLYLTTQLLEMDIDVVIALNMEDILDKKGIRIDINKLENELGCSIVSISAKKETGISDLIDLIKSKKYIKNKHLKIYPSDVEEVISNNINHFTPEQKFKRFTAVKVIEHDKEYLALENDANKDPIKNLEDKYQMDGEELIADKRYAFIEKIKKDCVKTYERPISITDKLDRILLNKYLAIPIFIVVMAIIYMLSVGVIGGLTVNLIDMLFNGTDVLELSIFSYNLSFEVNFTGLGPYLGEVIANVGGSP